MRLHEIQTAPKPPTPEQARIKGLQQSVEKTRDTLQAERDKQRQQRDAERKQKLQLPSTTSTSASI
jgi:type IV secretory pathway VirD2 relaxase